MGGATGGGTAEPTSRDQNKRLERGQGKENEKKSQIEVNSSRANGGGEAEQSGAFYDSTKGGIEHVHVDGKSQLPDTTYGRWRWMGNTGLDGR